MKNSLKTLLIGSLLVIVAGLIYFLLTKKSEDEPGHYKAVPADAVVVMSVHSGQLGQEMGLTSEKKIKKWSWLVDQLGESDNAGDKILRKFIHKPHEGGIDLESRTYVWVSSEKGAAYMGVVFALEDAEKFSSLIYPLRLDGFKERRTGGFDFLTTRDLAVGYSKRIGLIIFGFDGFSDKELVNVFKKLIKLPEEKSFFADQTLYTSMVEAPNDILVYGDVRKLLMLNPSFVSMGGEELLVDMPKDMLLKIDFKDGEMVAEMNQTFRKSRRKLLEEAGEAPSVKELFQYHSSSDLLFAMGASLNPHVLLYADRPANRPFWLKNAVADGVIMRDLVACMEGNMLITLNHPYMNLGPDLDQFLHGNSSAGNPLMKMVPEVRISFNLDSRKWEKVMPDLLSANIIKPYQQGFIIPVLNLPEGWLHPGYSEWYGVIHNDQMILSNTERILDKNILTASAGDVVSNKHITAENVEPGMVDLMLDVQKIWDIAHIPAESYEPLSLINEVDKLYLHSTDTDFVMTIKMKDKKQNPLAVLVPFLIDQY